MLTLVRWVAKSALLVLLFCTGAMLIDPATFISLDTANSFAEWTYGDVNQENFDELWVLTWIACSMLFSLAGYFLIIRIARKMRR